MNPDTSFCYLRLAGTQRTWSDVHAALGAAQPALAQHGIVPWGVWSGLFGLASNELVLVTSARHDAQGARVREALAEVATVVEQRLVRPTLRPTATDALARPGLYVFRFFDVMARDIDEFVALSGRAWTTFETAADYRSHPEGLFRPLDGDAVRSTMLLCTWYDGFESWQRSRTPAADARANFAARHALTLSTWAIATQLVSAGS